MRKVGLYYSFSFDTFTGPGEAGATRNDVNYDITIAKTLLPQETPYLGGFTVYLETYGITDLDGTDAGVTVVTLTPGIRFNLSKSDPERHGRDNNWILLGVDIPVTGPRPYDSTVRLTYIKTF